MAPTYRRTKEKTTKIVTRRIVTRSIYKKQQQQQQEEKEIIISSKCAEEKATSIVTKNDGCSTPKSNKNKIPEILTCPPAPKKPKVSSNNLFLQTRRPINFFAHPDLDKFFMFSLRDHIKEPTNPTQSDDDPS